MKKVLIAKQLHEMLGRHDSFLNRSGVCLFTAASTDDLLRIHHAERTDLIITPVGLAGISMPRVVSQIRRDGKPQPVRLLLISSNEKCDIELCARCKPDAVILRPINPLVLTARAQQLLAIAWRESYRAVVNVAVEGKAGDDRFLCRSLDISVSGILIETEKMLAAGSRIVCSFFLPDSTGISAAGEIVRAVAGPCGSNLYQYGVKFLSIPAQEKKSLETFMHDVSRTFSNLTS